MSAAARSVARCTESMRAARGLEHLEVVLQQLDLPAHDREHVVEVVRDAAGEPADRLHLLRLEQLLLEGLAFGDVAEHDDLELGRRASRRRSGDSLISTHTDVAPRVDQPGLARLSARRRAGPDGARARRCRRAGRTRRLGADQAVVGHGRAAGTAPGWSRRCGRRAVVTAMATGESWNVRRNRSAAAARAGLGRVALVEREGEAEHGEERDRDEHLQDASTASRASTHRR